METSPVTSVVPPWRFPPEAFVLGCDQFHVWQAPVDQPKSQIESFLDTIAADEQARAGRFHFERDRKQLIVARRVLQTIRGCYLNRPPEALAVERRGWGLACWQWPDPRQLSV